MADGVGSVFTKAGSHAPAPKIPYAVQCEFAGAVCRSSSNSRDCSAHRNACPVRADPSVYSFRITELQCAQFEAKLHRDMKPTRDVGLRGHLYPGRRSRREAAKECYVEWVNELPSKHFLPIDHSIHGAEAD